MTDAVGAPDMTVEFAGLRLKNPVIAASGTFGYGVEFESLLDLNELGGLVVKGLSRKPMAGNPSPRLAETPSGMLNSVGLQNIGVEEFVRQKLPRLRAFRTAVIANIFGETAEDYVEVVRRLESEDGLAAYELNLSCPNTKHGGVVFGTDPVGRSLPACRKPGGLSSRRTPPPMVKRLSCARVVRFYCRNNGLAFQPPAWVANRTSSIAEMSLSVNACGLGMGSGMGTTRDGHGLA